MHIGSLKTNVIDAERLDVQSHVVIQNHFIQLLLPRLGDDSFAISIHRFDVSFAVLIVANNNNNKKGE